MVYDNIFYFCHNLFNYFIFYKPNFLSDFETFVFPLYYYPNIDSPIIFPLIPVYETKLFIVSIGLKIDIREDKLSNIL